jgi:outer membrane autotransporter protein
MKRLIMTAVMRVKPARGGSNAGGCEPPTSSARRSGAIARRSAILLSGTAAIALSIAQPAGAIVINDQVAAAAGGIANYFDTGNQFPNVVRILNPATGQVACTGSLINSRTILTAAHCATDPATLRVDPLLGSTTISFQPNGGPPVTGITSYVRNPNFPPNLTSNANDTAVISLAQPITTISPVTIAGVVPAPGTVLTSVGYGGSGIGSGPSCAINPLNCGFDNKRRIMTTEFGALGTSFTAAGVNVPVSTSTQPFLLAQFRDPLDPNSTIPNNNPNNVFNLTVPTSPLEGGTVAGDSGGPVFIQTSAGLVQIGELFGGFPVLGTNYTDVSAWTPLALFLDWIAQNNPQRQVTAASGNFNWSNPAAWIDPFPDAARPNGAVPDNTRGQVNIDANEAARYYNVTLANPGTITLDMNPQIDNLWIMGAQSQLVIGGPYTLEVLLDTRLSAGALTMLPGGILATGTYTQTGGLLQYLLTPGGAGRITVVNTATLGGALGVTVMPGLYGLSTRYTLLSAGAISGQFAQFISVSPPSAFLSLSGPIYNPDPSVDVTVTRTPFGALPGLTRNQQAVGNALEAGYSTTRTGPAATLYTQLLTTGTPDALSQLSGEVHGSVQSVMVDDSRYIRQAVLGRLRQAPYAGGTGAIAALGSGGPTLAYAEPATDAALAYAAKKPSFPIKPPPFAAPAETPDLTFWAQGVGAWGKINSDGNAADASRNLSGVFTGFDRRFGDWRAGLAAGYSNSSVSVSARASSANIDTAYVAAYAGTSYWAWNFRSGATFAWNTIGTSRAIAFPSFFDQATTRYGAGEAQVFGELGYGLTFGAIAAEPFAGLAWVHLDTASFTETGGVSALIGTGHKEDVGYSTLGARVATYYLLQNGMALIPRASVAWQHAFGDVTPTAALTFQSIGSGFNIFGVPIARDAALVEAGGDLQLTAQAKIGVSYAGQLANSAHDHSVRGNFTWRF